MKTGKQPTGNKKGIQGIKITGTTGKPAAAKPTTNIASGKLGGGGKKARNRSSGSAGGGMGIGSLGGGKKRGFS